MDQMDLILWTKMFFELGQVVLSTGPSFLRVFVGMSCPGISCFWAELSCTNLCEDLLLI